MLKKSITRILIAATLVVVLTLSLAPPALAFDGRHGETVTIPAGEVVNDDLYIGAEKAVVIDGTIKGDLIVAAKTITINGTVEGDVIAAGQVIIINGTVKDDVRMAGAALQLGEKASIGSDLIGAGASLEARKGSSIGEDVVFAGGQALLAGDIGRNVSSTTGSLDLRGKIGGNVKADVGSEDSSHGGGPSSYMGNLDITVPNVKPGLTIDPAAKINGTLDYTTAKKRNIPEGAVAGKITYSEPKVDVSMVDRQPTLPELVMTGTFEVIRNIITFILFGLLLLWLFPAFIKTTTERVKTAPLPSLGWGIVHIAAFFFALLIITVAMIIGAIVFGVLTLGGLSGTIIVSGLLLMFAIIVGFSLAVGFVAEIIVSILGGQLILARIRPELAEHKYWPLIIGVVIYTIIAAIPIFGGLISIIAVLLGLGAVWYFGQEILTKKPVVA